MVQKRVRHNVIRSSDDEVEHDASCSRSQTAKDEQKEHSKAIRRASQPPPSYSALQQSHDFKRSLSVRTSNAAILSASNKSEKKLQGGSRSQRLDTSFNNTQTSHLKPQPNHEDKATSHEIQEDEDNIEDDFENLGTVKAKPLLGAHADNKYKTQERKRSWSVANEVSAITSKRPAPSKFVTKEERRDTVPSSTTERTENISKAPWTEQYRPIQINELAVHPRKVSAVRDWLSGVFNGTIHDRVLVLKGPAGVGKTSTVALLASQLSASIVEWHNPEYAEYTTPEFVSQSSQFADFLLRAGRFDRLQVIRLGDDLEHEPINQIEQGKSSTERQLVLVEEFPSIGGSSSTTSHVFREQILQYLASSSSASTQLKGHIVTCPVPLIMVISESVLSTSNTADNFTAHRLLGRDILHHPGVSVIEFNPVAPTIITKALKQVLQKHTRTTGRAQPTSPSIIQRLSEIGDLRNAVSTLEYLHRNSSPENANILRAMPTSGRAKSKKAKTSESSTAAVQNDAEAALALVASRESTLGLFHAVGKVVYNKRTQESSQSGDSIGRRPAPDLDSDQLLATAGASSSTFLSAIFENYALSCFPVSGPPSTDAVLASVEGSLDALVDADVLGTNSLGSFDNGRSPGFLSEGLRQDEIAFHVGVRGVQNALPYPVKRQAAEDGMNGRAQGRYNPDVHRMFYPMDLKLWRRREDTQERLDYLVQTMLREGVMRSDSVLSAQHDSNVDTKDFPLNPISQPGRTSGQARSSHPPGKDASKTRYETSASSECLTLGSGQSARKLLLLERLPYVLKISGNHGFTHQMPNPSASILQDVQNIVEFSGTGIRRDEDSDDEAGTTSRNPRSGLGPSGLPKRTSHLDRSALRDGNVKEDVAEKLVLSDDDIEDD